MYIQSAPVTVAMNQMEFALTMLEAIGESALDCTIKILDVNLSAGRTALAEATVGTRQLLTNPTPSDWFSNGAHYGQSGLSRAFSYLNEIGAIVGAMHNKLAIITGRGASLPKQKTLALADARGAGGGGLQLVAGTAHGTVEAASDY